MSAVAQRTRLRLVPVPVTDPPFDDEDADAVPRLHRRPTNGRTLSSGVQGTLALAFHVGRGVPAVPSPPRRLDGAARAVPGVGRPEARRWAAMLVQGVAEAVTGDRPLNQLVRWTTLEVYEQLQWECRRRTREPAAARHDRVKASVRSVHVFEPSSTAAEVCATISWAGRAQAFALRMEAHGEAWRCTAIKFC